MTSNHHVIAILGDVAEYINGRAFKPSEWGKEGLPIIRIKNLNDKNSKFNYSNEVFEKRYLVKKGDLLFAWSASLGAYIWKKDEAWLNQHIFLVKPSPFIAKLYLYYFLDKITQELYSAAHGSGMVHVTKKKFEETKIGLPPLPEQRAIVAKIEQLFSELDNGIACLKKAQEQLKVYRQAVLKQAFDGELTKTWREQQANLPSAQDLLDTIKAEREQTAKNQGKKLKPIKPITQTELSEWSELPDGWKWVRVDEILQSGRECGYGVLQPGENVVNGVSLIRVGDVFDGRIDYLNLKKISLDIANKYKRTFLQGGEVLITLVGAIGRTAVVPEFCKGANIARAVGVVPLSKKLNPFFVELYFRQAKKIQELTDKSHEVARKTLNLEDVKNATVIIAPLAEQEQIVQEIETRLSVCDNMGATIREALEKAEALRQSILKKAFEGKLLSDEELTATRNDPDWEPAGKLLERIKAEKNQSK
ncbi:MAG: restriction endonuclease subunit S [Chlorobium sp.]|uniref:restriction endonuclease subunit S n=1 Tax=Chlorobium sp. TaxID=1095 RepID=UPI0025C28767|nr:restriction endonuclease subunit S [Chlorobium sp.]MCF8216582.1 restriction endonuclease subunit S [Chlorobium sp.]MCF8270909.1 restriction endonuclease subunit S [Chlorobium sp.]MCF8287157.1 restriction endonuclease subunit S [Chlorobium sp.]MCF8290814.1 restriction endonuclease subunit S [Chlorobium sp.]MCF8385493.1 restriction endonuclease subunit S [Chlorobium sp.]